MAFKLTDLFRRLTGGGQGHDGAPQARGPAVEYNGFTIQAAPRRQGSQWLTAGVINKDFPDGVQEHHFIRAETHASQDEAQAFAIVKAKKIIDERGDLLFQNRAPSPPSAG